MQAKLSYFSPLGPLILSSNGTDLTGLQLRAHFTSPETGSPSFILPVFQESILWLDHYFSGKVPGHPPTLLPEGTPFQTTIWKLLMDIPYGQVCSYRQIAQRAAVMLGRSHMAAQAVGGALGRNPLPIFIPCHRVVGIDGSLTGYIGGLALKKALLLNEGVPVVNDIVQISIH